MNAPAFSQISAAEELSFGFQLGSKLSFSNGVIDYSSPDGPWSLDTKSVFFTAAHHGTPAACLADSPAKIKTALYLASRAVARSKTGHPIGRSISRQIYLLRHVYDWLGARNIDFLSEARESDLHDMIVAFAEHGWPHALNVRSRWYRALESMPDRDIQHAFHFKSEGGRRVVDAIRQAYWRRKLGWGGGVPVPTDIRNEIEFRLGSDFSAVWKGSSGQFLPPSTTVLRNTLTHINQWASLERNLDKPNFRISRNSCGLARRLTTRKSSKTRVLTVSDASSVIKTAVNVLENVAPLLQELLTDPALGLNAKNSGKHAQEVLETSEARARIETIVGKKITRWVWTAAHNGTHAGLCVDELVATVLGACFMILCVMNGRRSAEICHPRTGLRVNSLTVIDYTLQIYKVAFYIEKTHFSRHPFYVNQLSARAILCLVNLRNVLWSSPQDPTDSLFLTGRRSARGLNESKALHFRASYGIRGTRTLSSFFKVMGSQMTVPSVKPHSFRRFFALLYYYRYEHADLLSLQQHMRHLSIAMTKHYVTSDSGDFFVEMENSDTMPLTAEPSLERELREVGFEKLLATIDQSLNNSRSSGGFTKLIRAMYRKLTSSLHTEEVRVRSVANLLVAAGHTVTPLPFGQCHSSERRAAIGNCRSDGKLQVAQSSLALCFSCPYHFTSSAYVDSIARLREDLHVKKSQAIQSSVEAASLSCQIEHADRLLALLTS